MLGFAGLNFCLAVSHNVSDAVNWLAGIVSVVAGAVCLGMVVHMRNDKIHVPDLVDLNKLVSTDMCNEKVSNMEKLQKLNNKMLELMIQNAGLRLPKDGE